MYKKIAENILSDYSLNDDLLSDSDYLFQISWNAINKGFKFKDFDYIKAGIYIINSYDNFNYITIKSTIFYKIIRKLHLFNNIDENIDYLLSNLSYDNDKNTLKGIISISIIKKKNYLYKIYDRSLIGFNFEILNNLVEYIILPNGLSIYLEKLIYCEESIEVLYFLLNNKTIFGIKTFKENYYLYSNIFNIKSNNNSILNDIFILKLHSIIKLTLINKNEYILDNFLVSIKDFNLDINFILEKFIKVFKSLKKGELLTLEKIVRHLSEITNKYYTIPSIYYLKSLYVNEDGKGVNEEKRWIESLIQKDMDKLLFISESGKQLNDKLSYFARLGKLKIVMKFGDQNVLYVIDKKSSNREILLIHTELGLGEKSNNKFYEKINKVIYDFLQNKLNEDSGKFFEVVSKNRFFYDKPKLDNNYYNDYGNERLF